MKKELEEIKTNELIANKSKLIYKDPLYKVPRKGNLTLVKRWYCKVMTIEIIASKTEHYKFSEDDPNSNNKLSSKILKQYQNVLEKYIGKENAEFVANTYLTNRRFLWNSYQTIKIG